MHVTCQLFFFLILKNNCPHVKSQLCHVSMLVSHVNLWFCYFFLFNVVSIFVVFVQFIRYFRYFVYFSLNFC